MKRISLPKLLLLSLLLLVTISAGSALAATNNIPLTRLDEYTSPPITPNDLKPPECNSIDLNNLVVGSGNIKGTDNNDLILGSNINDRINPTKKGDAFTANCIVAGAGDDDIRGKDRDEIILGGPGNDDIRGGDGYDICYGGPGDDWFKDCEVCYGGGGNDDFGNCGVIY